MKDEKIHIDETEDREEIKDYIQDLYSNVFCSLERFSMLFNMGFCAGEKFQEDICHVGNALVRDAETLCEKGFTEIDKILECQCEKKCEKS